jgi:hypothetical protein
MLRKSKIRKSALRGDEEEQNEMLMVNGGKSK